MKLPCDQKPYKVMDIKGAQTTCQRGGKEKQRSRNIKEAGMRLRLRGGTTNKTRPQDKQSQRRGRKTTRN